jgi:hypothetical protein
MQKDCVTNSNNSPEQKVGICFSKMVEAPGFSYIIADIFVISEGKSDIKATLTMVYVVQENV